ncbi:MAG: hypothetical protein OXI16_14990 [Chloroflexota bacterium]|nr:hypothetical protein [Chloroflexota bacterium]
MSAERIPDDAPAAALFPEYGTLYDLIAPEVEGLTDEQLDWTSDKWGWAEWSIRRQMSHMASLLYRWMAVRWADTLFPDSDHGIEDVEGIAVSDNDRALDVRYHDMDVILDILREGIEMAQAILSERTAGFLRSNTLVTEYNPERALVVSAHPHGITLDAEAGTETTTLEATFRHMYFEETTHLYNIQRLKRAQGLPTVSEVPQVGYWMLDGWDRSEPE